MAHIPLKYLEISKSNLVHNFQSLKSIAKKGTLFSVAVKGNAYGHGLKEVVQVLDNYVDYFQVNSIEELIELRKFSKNKVFCFGYIQGQDLKKAIQLKAILTFFSIEQLHNINNQAKSLGLIQEVHMPIDAYLGREGFLQKEWKDVLTAIKKMKNIYLGGIYAHFANIEDTNNFTHARKQIKEYQKVLKLAESFGFKKIKKHISATSGLLVYEKDKGINNIIRLGIGVYGLWPSSYISFFYKNRLELKPVLSFKTKIAQIKYLEAGRTIGYGLTYMTHENIKIAVIPVGYADGYSRELSNKGEVLIQGIKCKILGRISMNMFVVDITQINNVFLEDEVVLLGKMGNCEIKAEELAEKINTINYEIVTCLSPLLHKRIVF